MEQIQLRLKESGKTVVYTAKDLTLMSVESFLKTCLKDYFATSMV